VLLPKESLSRPKMTAVLLAVVKGLRWCSFLISPVKEMGSVREDASCRLKPVWLV